MEIQRSRIIEGKNAVELAVMFGKAMEELKNNKPSFDKLSDTQMLIRYTEVEKPKAKVINLKQSGAPKCKDCPHYESNEGAVRGEQVTWGRCGCLLDAAVNGNKPICRIRSKEEREEVQIERRTEQYKSKRSNAL